MMAGAEPQTAAAPQSGSGPVDFNGYASYAQGFFS
jgi:hypothetical protein